VPGTAGLVTGVVTVRAVVGRAAIGSTWVAVGRVRAVLAGPGGGCLLRGGPHPGIPRGPFLIVGDSRGVLGPEAGDPVRRRDQVQQVEVSGDPQDVDRPPRARPAVRLGTLLHARVRLERLISRQARPLQRTGPGRLPPETFSPGAVALT
jgi:hypothetical protein